MKTKEIKERLGKGTLLWVEACKEDWDEDFGGKLPGIVVHHKSDIEYNPLCLYPFEKFIKLEDTDSKIVKFVCEKFSVKEVFVYQPCLVGTNEEDKIYTLFDEKCSHKIYDCDCSYLISVKKTIADNIPYDGEEYIIECN